MHWDSRHYHVTLAQHEHIDLALERERDQQLANYKEQRERLINEIRLRDACATQSAPATSAASMPGDIAPSRRFGPESFHKILTSPAS